MKRRIITAVALLAVMIALTGAASAISVGWQKNGVEQDPIPMKNGETTDLDMRIHNLRPWDNNTVVNLTMAYLDCTNEKGISKNTDPNVSCDVSDITPFNVLKPKITIRQTPEFVESGVVKVSLHAPLNRKPGTRYSFTGTLEPFLQPLEIVQTSLTILFMGANITGAKFNDLDGNGIRGATEPGLAGWTINLRNETGAIVATTQTDANGNYIFSNIRGNFTVEEVLQPGWTQTAPPTGTFNVTVDAQDITGLDFGNILKGSISGQKWNDLNGDGIKDANEPRLANWTIVLTMPDGTKKTAQTDANGNYIFSDLLPGTYTVGEVLQAGWTQTAPPEGTYTVTLSAGQNATDRDFGNRIATGSISGQKWNDTNGDGIKGANEPRLAGWTIVLTMPDGTKKTAQTDANGNYIFSDLPPGTYTVAEVLQQGWNQTAPKPIPPGTYTVTLSAGQDVIDRDFGNWLPPPPPPCVEICKVVGWGTLGNKAAPELTFKLFAFTKFMPKGTVEAEDSAGNKITLVKIDSVVTNKNVTPMTGEITGTVMFNDEGPFAFTVRVTDGGEPSSAPYVSKDTFEISIPAKNYHKEGTLTSGDIQVVY